MRVVTIQQCGQGDPDSCQPFSFLQKNRRLTTFNHCIPTKLKYNPRAKVRLLVVTL